MRRRWAVGIVALLAVLGGVGGWLWANRAHGERVLAIGDSLMAQAGPAVSQHLGAKGYDVQVSAAPGTGLLDTRDDWGHTAAQLISSFDPDIVVVEFIGDYGPQGIRPGVPPDSPAFFSAWRFAAQRLEDILTENNAQVYWVVGPPVAQATGQATLRRLDAIYRGLHAPNTGSGHPPIIDLNPAFSVNGAYAEYVPGPNGSPVQVRQADGTHLTPAGAELFAQVVAENVKPVSPLRRLG